MKGAGEEGLSFFHSVTLDPERCVGCTTCIKKCPTEAIRVRKGRARIIAERCIDCGECIRTCPHGAKKAYSDSLANALSAYRYRVAMPAPTLYSQFDESVPIDRILSGLLALGFDEVYEVAEGADRVTAATRELLSRGPEAGAAQVPMISSACPAVVKLVQVRFPSLIPHLAPLLPPMEVSARVVKEVLHKGEEGVGVFFISPCAGKVTSVRSPLGYEASAVDGVIGVKDIYLPLRAALAKATPHPGLSRATRGGTAWAAAEGEVRGLGEGHSIAVDGIGSVIGVLEALENGKLKGITYIEALACPAGCVGGPLTVENPYIAKARIASRAASLPLAFPETPRYEGPVAWDRAIQPRSSRILDPDMLKAMIMLEEMEHLASQLPGLDCGSCGSPTCQSLAEDVVRGNAVETDCIFKLRETVRALAGELLALEEIKPPGLDKEY